MEGQSKEQKLVTIPNRPIPWLVISDVAKDKRHVFYSVKEERYNSCFVPELQNKYISCCYKGWSLVEDHNTDDFYLLNISTREKLVLPPLSIPDHHKCVLSSTPTDDGCLVLFIGYLDLWSCHIGDSEFVKQDLKFECAITKAVVNFEGKLNVLTLPDYDLYTAGFSDPSLRFSPVIRGESLAQILPINDAAKFYLIDSCGELLFVNRSSFGFEVLDFKIFKADFTNKEWVLIEDLGDRALFLDEHKGFSSLASKFGLKGNCVYYVDDFDRNLYCYDLEDGLISMSLPCPTVAFESSMSWVSLPSVDQDE